MTTVYGEWMHDKRDGLSGPLVSPVVAATLLHKNSRKGSLVFLMDSGAQQSLIVQEDQDRLGIPDRLLSPAETKAQTLGGFVAFRFLTVCSLVFSNANGETIEVPGLTLFFPSRPTWRQKWFGNKYPRPLAGEGEFKSILGRDVLQRFSVGWSMSNAMLFHTDEHSKYQDAFKRAGFWPPPPSPLLPDPNSIPWSDGPHSPVIT